MSEKVKATPAARRIAAERSIELSRVSFSPEIGYIRADDVAAFKGGVKATPLAASVAAYHGIDVSLINTNGIIGKNDVLSYIENMPKDKHIPVAGVRKVVAERMMQSASSAPQYSQFVDVDMSALIKRFSKYKADCAQRGATKPTLSDAFIKLFANALLQHPMLNSTFAETEIIIHKDINIGLAVAVDNGLTVPNIKNADKKSMAQITEERAAIVKRAREGKLSSGELTGGTFTVSNLGGFEVEYATPIINMPESAIVVTGKTVERVVPVDGNIGIRPMMGLSFTFDHRHVDGAVGGAFMTTVKELFENPDGLFDGE